METKTIDIVAKVHGRKRALTLELHTYQTGNLAIIANTKKGEPFATLTVNLLLSLPQDDCRYKWVYLDTNNLPEVTDIITDNELGVTTGLVGRSGYCTYPAYRIDTWKFR